MRVMNSGLQEYQLKKQIERHIESDLVDVTAYLDDTLTLSENISQFKQMGFIEQDFYDISEEQAEEFNHINKFYRCKKCGNENMTIRKYDSHTGKQNWIVVECECGFWNSFYDNTNYRR